jgi:hypothetical protein
MACNDDAVTAYVPPGGPLEHDELRQLFLLLARYCWHELDQRENWKLDLPKAAVYLSIVNQLPPGALDEAFATIWPLPPHLADAQESLESENARYTLRDLRAWLATSLRIVRQEPHSSGLTALSVPDDAEIIAEARRLRAVVDQIEPPSDEQPAGRAW